MKFFIFYFLFFTSLLFANDPSDKLRVEIIKNIVLGIKNSEPMSVWSDDGKIMKALRSSDEFKVVDNCRDAGLIILNDKSSLPKNINQKHIFVLKYSLLHKIPDSFGAFFWKKGRPNIVFIKPRVQKQSLKLSTNLKPYIEDKVW